MSCICPARFPERSSTGAPTSLLARQVASFICPVAVRCFVLQVWLLCICVGEPLGFGGVDCAREVADSIVEAAQIIVT